MNRTFFVEQDGSEWVVVQYDGKTYTTVSRHLSKLQADLACSDAEFHSR